MYIARLLKFILTIITLTSGYVIKRSKNNDFILVTTDIPKITLLPYVDRSRDGRQMFDELSTETPSVTNVALTTNVPTYTVAYYLCFMITEYIGPCTCKPQRTTVTGSTSDDFIKVSTKSTIVDSENVFNKSTTTTITNEPQTTIVSGSTTNSPVDVSTKSQTTTSVINEPQTTTVAGCQVPDCDVTTKSSTTIKTVSDEEDESSEYDEYEDFWDIYIWIATEDD